MQKSLQLVFFLTAIRGQIHWLQDPKSHFTYQLSKQFPDEFMVSAANLQSSSTQNNAHFVYFGPMFIKKEGIL